MDEESKETLLRIKENHSGLTKLYIGDDADDEYYDGSIFYSNQGSDFSTLGRYIATNTFLNKLEVNNESIVNINICQGFYDGLRRNSTIQELILCCTDTPNVFGTLRGTGNEILSAYHANSSHLTNLCILRTILLQDEVEHVALTLRSCTNLKVIVLNQCNITDQKLVQIVEALRGRTSLEELYLNDNRIGKDGCQALAYLFRDRSSNLEKIQLSDNNIGNEGAITLADSLANNTKLVHLCMTGNQIDQSSAGNFYNLLCNTTSINNTYSSNHTLEEVQGCDRWGEVASLLGCNRYMKKYAAAAINKILRYHPNIDMEPFFEMGTEDSERNLQGLPYVIDWFERAKEAVLDISFIKNGVVQGQTFLYEDTRIPLVDTRKLSAIYQFARDMPLMFVDQRVCRRSKRKRVGR